MKRRLVVWWVLAAAATASAQDESRVWNLGYRYHATTFDFGEVKTLMRGFIRDYVVWGVPVRLQTEFPGNGLHAVELAGTKGWTRVGVGAAYGQTLGYGGFHDGNGDLTISVEAAVRLVYMHAGLTNIRFDGGGGYLSAKAGAAFVSLSSLESVTFVDLPQYNLYRSQSASGAGPYAEIAAGGEVRVISVLVIGVEAGYRFGTVRDLALFRPDLKRKAELEGMTLSVLIGVEL